MRGRGLKLVKPIEPTEPVEVAPHAGAWIETKATASGV